MSGTTYKVSQGAMGHRMLTSPEVHLNDTSAHPSPPDEVSYNSKTKKSSFVSRLSLLSTEQVIFPAFPGLANPATPQPRPQGLLLDDYQNSRSSGEDPSKAELTPLLIGPFIRTR